MAEIEFKPWPKIARLNRDIIITEKIDGTNAAVGIIPVEGSEYPMVYAQSRTRIITPGKSTDNYAFAQWVYDNQETLVADLGEGLHFGEWWGVGIQRNYGLYERRFSLFNTSRYNAGDRVFKTPGVGTVPVLYTGPFDTNQIVTEMAKLRLGSVAAPGFPNPEGVVIFHGASGTLFKALLEGDDVPKGLA